MSDLVWIYKSHDDSWTELSAVAARGVVDGFIRGGSAINVINGGVRVQVPGGHYWDFIVPNSLDPSWRHGRGVGVDA